MQWTFKRGVKEKSWPLIRKLRIENENILLRKPNSTPIRKLKEFNVILRWDFTLQNMQGNNKE